MKPEAKPEILKHADGIKHVPHCIIAWNKGYLGGGSRRD
jgi:hypothetical protein